MSTAVLCADALHAVRTRIPPRHSAALGPGVSPAWVALLGFLLLSRRPEKRTVAGAALCLGGILVLTAWSASAHNTAVLMGDLMFLAASALGALYVLHLRTWGIGALQGAALVSLYSAFVVVPWHLWSASSALSNVTAGELAWQVLWQGVLIGCVALIALNQAITKLGAERSSALVALVPVLSALMALIFLGEVPSAAEMAAFLAISAGVSLGAIPAKPAMREALLLAVPQRSARPVGYPFRDSAP
jgi:drug/metabolite transporter (DMT)-like permease